METMIYPGLNLSTGRRVIWSLSTELLYMIYNLAATLPK